MTEGVIWCIKSCLTKLGGRGQYYSFASSGLTCHPRNVVFTTKRWTTGGMTMQNLTLHNSNSWPTSFSTANGETVADRIQCASERQPTHVFALATPWHNNIIMPPLHLAPAGDFYCVQLACHENEAGVVSIANWHGSDKRRRIQLFSCKLQSGAWSAKKTRGH